MIRETQAQPKTKFDKIDLPPHKVGPRQPFLGTLSPYSHTPDQVHIAALLHSPELMARAVQIPRRNSR